MSEITGGIEGALQQPREVVEITSSAMALSEMNHWLEGFMRPSDGGKLVLMGFRSYAFIFRLFDPATPQFYRGNAHQRRNRRRYRARMWAQIGGMTWPTELPEDATVHLTMHPLFR